MSRRDDNTALVLGTTLGAVGVLGALAAALWPRSSGAPASLPSSEWLDSNFTEADVEAAARMLASENPRASRQLQIEQIHTQLRSRKRGQSLFDRITAGSGFGPQGERQYPGKVRPVATEEKATDEQRKLAREVLGGVHPSLFAGARRFFEPDQQDKAFAIGERARAKRSAGQPLTKQEQRLIKYKKNANDKRKEWLSEGLKFIGVLEGVEFYT